MNGPKHIKLGQGRRGSRRRRAFSLTDGDFKGLSHEGVSRSLRFMAQHYTRQIYIRDLVTVSGMSRRGFIKAFDRHIGRSPGSLIRQARIELAKQLLVEKDWPLKSIATIVGYRSENTFCVAFYRAMGVAPKKYQRQTWLAERAGRLRR